MKKKKEKMEKNFGDWKKFRFVGPKNLFEKFLLLLIDKKKCPGFFFSQRRNNDNVRVKKKNLKK